MVKFVLEGILVYWFSLTKVPKAILSRTSSVFFWFLWSRTKKEVGIPLVKWNKLAKDKKISGWGIKDLMLIDRALASKRLWHCMHDMDLWVPLFNQIT